MEPQPLTESDQAQVRSPIGCRPCAIETGLYYEMVATRRVSDAWGYVMDEYRCVHCGRHVWIEHA